MQCFLWPYSRSVLCNLCKSGFRYFYAFLFFQGDMSICLVSYFTFKENSVYLEHTQNVLTISQHYPCQAILCLRRDSLILVSHCSCPVRGILGWQMNQAPLMSLWFCVFLKTFTMPGNKWIIFITEKFNLWAKLQPTRSDWQNIIFNQIKFNLCFIKELPIWRMTIFYTLLHSVIRLILFCSWWINLWAVKYSG